MSNSYWGKTDEKEKQIMKMEDLTKRELQEAISEGVKQFLLDAYIGSHIGKADILKSIAYGTTQYMENK